MSVALALLDNVSINHPEIAQYIKENIKQMCER